jgi:NAD(P)-dependent dehydrogenase (short-subunit alcohol dehydrogenase family)
VLGKEGAMPLKQFAGTVMVNLVGSFNVAKTAAELMQHNEAGIDGERGVIVNTASVAALRRTDRTRRPIRRRRAAWWA